MRPSLVRWLSEARSSAHWQKWIMQLPLRQSLDLRVLNRINAQRRLPLTYDRGRTLTQPEQLAEKTGIKVYFADPHSPWQRGSNGNTNSLLRQYFPKRTDLSGFTPIELDAVACNLIPVRVRDSDCSALQNCLCLTPLTFFSITINTLHFELKLPTKCNTKLEISVTIQW